MTTQVMGTVRRSRMGAALVALAFAFAVFVLANEASSALSTGTGQQVQPPPVHVSLSAKELKDLSISATLPAGCRVKYGCQPKKGSNAEPLNGSHIPFGCRVKFGCH
jgi:acyl-CoA reductase-like NAD-dependent aldehyde dehydrogenase